MIESPITISNKRLTDRAKLHILVLLFLFALLFPPFDMFLGNFGSGLVNIGLIIWGILVFQWHGLTIKFYHKKELMVTFLILGVMAYNFLTIFINQLIHLQKISFRDVVEYYRPVLYTVSFCLPMLLIHKSKDFAFITKVLLALMWCCFALSVGQIFGLAIFYGGLYTRELNYIGMRMAVPFITPYDYSYFLNLFLAYFAFRFLETRRIKMIVIALVPAVLILFTQSRGGFVGAVFLIFVIVPTILFFKHIRQLLAAKINRQFLLLMVMSVLIVLASAITLYSLKDTALRYLWTGKKILTMTSNDKQPRSVVNRAAQIEYAVDEALKDPFVAFFGKGSLKSEGELLESIYAYYASRYGLIGFIVLLIFPLGIGVFYAFSNSLSGPNAALWQAICAWLMLLPVIGATNNLNEQMRLSFFYYFFIGMCVRGYYLRFSTDT